MPKNNFSKCEAFYELGQGADIYFTYDIINLRWQSTLFFIQIWNCKLKPKTTAITRSVIQNDWRCFKLSTNHWNIVPQTLLHNTVIDKSNTWGYPYKGWYHTYVGQGHVVPLECHVWLVHPYREVLHNYVNMRFIR